MGTLYLRLPSRELDRGSRKSPGARGPRRDRDNGDARLASPSARVDRVRARTRQERFWHRDAVHRAGYYDREINPLPSSTHSILRAHSTASQSSVVRARSGDAGGSYGSSTPVKPVISPRRARA